jgi:hypothetical protein
MENNNQKKSKIKIPKNNYNFLSLKHYQIMKYQIWTLNPLTNQFLMKKMKIMIKVISINYCNFKKMKILKLQSNKNKIFKMKT